MGEVGFVRREERVRPHGGVRGMGAMRWVSAIGLVLGCGGGGDAAGMQDAAAVEHRGTREIRIGGGEERKGVAAGEGAEQAERTSEGMRPEGVSIAGPLEAARVLIERGMEAEAEVQLRRAHREGGTRREASRLLWSLVGARESRYSVDERHVESLQKLLGDRFVRYESRHVVALSDATRERVNVTLGTLERTRTMFIRWAERAGLDPAPERSKHVCVVFSTREGYLAFARERDGIDASNLGGHYAPARERMALYVDPPDAPASEALTIRAMHEAAHMVAFRTGTQTITRAQPFWLSEGLASAFEATSITGAFGPDIPRSEVREKLERLVDSGKSVGLAELVVQRAAPLDDPVRAGAMYVQSEALVRYLGRHRRAQLSAYMHALATDTPGPRMPGQLLEEFVAYFGDPSLIERDLLRRPW